LAWVKKPRRVTNKAGRTRPRTRPRAHAHALATLIPDNETGTYNGSCNADNYIEKEHRMNPELSELAHLRTLSTVYAMMGMEVPEIERLTSLEAKYATKEKV